MSLRHPAPDSFRELEVLRPSALCDRAKPETPQVGRIEHGIVAPMNVALGLADELCNLSLLPWS